MHVTKLRKPPYCMTISVCPFVLIMMLILPYLLCHMNLNYKIFVDSSSLCKKHSEHQTLVSFPLLTSIVLNMCGNNIYIFLHTSRYKTLNSKLVHNVLPVNSFLYVWGLFVWKLSKMCTSILEL
jgi:hypothetical protein